MSDEKHIGNEINSSNEPVRIRSWSEIMQNGDHKKNIDERTDAMIYVKPFPFKEVDLLTIKRFIQFCRFNSKNDWGLGLKQLLDMIDGDAKTMMLYERIRQLEDKVEVLETTPKQKEETKKNIKKTFGRREE